LEILEKNKSNKSFQVIPSVEILPENGVGEAKKNKVILQTLVKTK
jgi:hypothetical protein